MTLQISPAFARFFPNFQSTFGFLVLYGFKILEHEFGYDLNIFNPIYAPILNELGIVKVGGDIFQFTQNTLKIWKNGKVEQLDILAQTTNPTVDIQIISMESSIGSMNNRVASIWTDNCISEEIDSGARMILNGVFHSDFFEPNTPEIIFVKYSINIKSQIKDAQDNWQYDNEAQVKLSGASNSYFEISDGVNIYNHNFQHNYAQHRESGNYYLIGYESGIYEMQSPYFFTQPAELISCSWSAKNLMSTGISFECHISK